MNYSIKLLSFSLILSALILSFFSVLPARADCTAGGQTYTTGQTGPDGRTCTPQGTWL